MAIVVWLQVDREAGQKLYHREIRWQYVQHCRPPRPGRGSECPGRRVVAAGEKEGGKKERRDARTRRSETVQLVLRSARSKSSVGLAATMVRSQMGRAWTTTFLFARVPALLPTAS